MALKDIFDPDKRSKDDLRSEIGRRDEQIADLLRTVSELRTATTSIDTRATDSQVPDQEKQTGQTHGKFEAEIASLKADILEQRQVLEESQGKTRELENLLGEMDKKNQVAKSELEEERHRRRIAAENNRQKYESLLHALNVVKQKVPDSSGGASQHPQPSVSAHGSQDPATESTTLQPSRDRQFYLDAHRLLMQREAQIEAVERQMNALLSHFFIADKSQIVSLPARLAAVAQGIEELRKGAGAQQLVSLHEQIKKANEVATKLANERDELLRTLSKDPDRSSAMEAVRLGNLLGEAQTEIRHLRGRISDRESEFRNLNLRVTQLGSANTVLKAKNERLKKDSISIEAHQIRCDELKSAAALEKSQAEGFRKQLELADQKLCTANKQIDSLTKDLASERSKPPAVVGRGETSFTNPIVLRWLVEEGGPETAEVPNGWLGRTGEGPWPDVLFAETLEDVAYKFWELSDSDLRHLVVGRKGWTKEELLAQIDAVDEGPLRIYSQEMFLAKLMTGRDPFDSTGDELLLAFAKGHPALEFLIGLPEPWPTVCDGGSRPIEPVDRDDYGVTESPLHLLGYHVGATSRITESRRRELLTECFKTNSLKFTDESSDDYRRKWGRGGRAQRLYRMAVHIKWLADGQGKDSRKPQARLDWVNDLKWLRKTFHQPMTRRFRWP